MEIKIIEELDELADDISEKYGEISEYNVGDEIQLSEIYDKSFQEFESLAQKIVTEENLSINFQSLPVIAKHVLRRSDGNDVVNKSIVDEYVARASSFINTVFIKAEESGVIFSNKENLSNTDVLIIVPLKEEISEFKNVFLCSNRPHRKGNSKLFFSKVNDKNITILQPNSMGQTDATAAAANIIESSKPDFIFVSGIAAGFDKNPQQLGDIVIPESILQYDRIRKVEDVVCDKTGQSSTETKASSKQYPISDKLYKSIEDFIQDSTHYEDWQKNNIENKISINDFSTIPKAILGETLASADEVQASAKRIKELTKTNRKLIGQDMESAGVIVASMYCDYNPDVITIRGISDWGANKETLEESTSGEVRAIAAKRAASFIKNYLMSNNFNEINQG